MTPTPDPIAAIERDETLAEEFARLTNEYHTGDEHTKPEAWNLLADFAVDNAATISAALSALVEEKPVAGKALEWQFMNENGVKAWTALDPFGHPFEHLTDCQGWWSSWRLPAFTGQFENQFETLEKGKAAAQADYEQRIRSAVAPAPAGEDVVDMPADLVQRCEEVLEWDQAGILQDGGELRALAGRIRAKFGDALSEGEALSHAEESSKREAMRLIVALSRKPSDAQTVGDGSTSTAKGCGE